MDNVSLFFIFGATGAIYLIFLPTLVLGLKGGINEKRAFLLALLALPIAVLLIKIIHLFIFEPRPFVTFNFTPLVKETADASFPSRHATISALIAFSFTYFKSRWSIIFIPLMLWVGISRVYVGVHYPLDILGGFFVAVISIILALQIKKFFKKYFFLS